MIDIANIRKDFPILSKKINGHNLIYLDNAATTQLPDCVLECVRAHYLSNNANVHRGIHTLSERSTTAFESARDLIRTFITANSSGEIVFTYGTTDAINLVAYGIENQIKSGDTLLATELEHHSNFMPWQRLCRDTGAAFAMLPCPNGYPDLEIYNRLLRTRRIRLVAITQVSNLTGTIMPIKEMIRLAHQAGALVLIDGAQGIRHCGINVTDIDADFYCFSGHKIIGPSGIGVLYGKRKILETLEPMRVGGGMVDIVTENHFTYGTLPLRFEGGTPNYPGAIALAEALKYVNKIGKANIIQYENELTAYTEARLREIAGLNILGTQKKRGGVFSFTLDGIHPYDAASILDKFGVAVRSGTHCAQPALKAFGTTSAIRISPAFYNTKEEIDETCNAIKFTQRMMSKWTKGKL